MGVGIRPTSVVAEGGVRADGSGNHLVEDCDEGSEREYNVT